MLDRKSLAAAVATLIGSTSPVAALALPWDVDMVDSPARRAYSCWEYTKDDEGNRVCVRGMQPLPEGVVAQSNILSPSAMMTPEIDKANAAAWSELINPIRRSPETLAKGERMFNIYCTPCHGTPNADGKIEHLGTVAQPGRMAGVIGLTGDSGILQSRNDGQVYRAIRVGNAIMPSYGWAMTDEEMWSVVHYTRTLDNGAYRPPTPAANEEAQQ
jgi:mono/diheme cytochrome c family protein